VCVSARECVRPREARAPSTFESTRVREPTETIELDVIELGNRIPTESWQLNGMWLRHVASRCVTLRTHLPATATASFTCVDPATGGLDDCVAVDLDRGLTRGFSGGCSTVAVELQC
jgi:hypothetical protein